MRSEEQFVHPLSERIVELVPIAELKNAEQFQHSLIVKRQDESPVIGQCVFASLDKKWAVVEATAADYPDLTPKGRKTAPNLVQLGILNLAGVVLALDGHEAAR